MKVYVWTNGCIRRLAENKRVLSWIEKNNFEPLFSRVMPVGLLTGPRVEGRTCVLSGPIFSGPVNRARSG